MRNMNLKMYLEKVSSACNKRFPHRWAQNNTRYKHCTQASKARKATKVDLSSGPKRGGGSAKRGPEQEKGAHGRARPSHRKGGGVGRGSRGNPKGGGNGSRKTNTPATDFLAYTDDL